MNNNYNARNWKPYRPAIRRCAEDGGGVPCRTGAVIVSTAVAKKKKEMCLQSWWWLVDALFPRVDVSSGLSLPLAWTCCLTLWLFKDSNPPHQFVTGALSRKPHFMQSVCGCVCVRERKSERKWVAADSRVSCPQLPRIMSLWYDYLNGCHCRLSSALWMTRHFHPLNCSDLISVKMWFSRLLTWSFIVYFPMHI